MRPRMFVARCCCGVTPPPPIEASEVRRYSPSSPGSIVVADNEITLIASPVSPTYTFNTHTYHWYSSLNVPNGATIVSARMVSMVNFVSGTPRVVNIALHNVDDSVHPGSSNPAFLPKTVATIWNATSADNQTSNFAASMQQVVNRPGWVSGNSIGIFFESAGGTSLPAPHDRLSWNSTLLEVTIA